MLFQGAQVVEPDIGCQLKFQDDPVRPQCAEKLFPSLSLQVRRIQAVADPDTGHFLAGQERFADALYAFFNIVPESVIFSGVTIEEGAVVKDSIVMPGSVIKSGAKVQYAIVAENVVVEADAQVGKRPEDVENIDDWGVAVVGPNVTVGKGACVEPKAMIGEDVKGAE